MLAKRLIKSNDAGGGGGCTNTVDLYNPFPDGGGVALYQLNGDATDVSGNYDGTASNVTYGAGQFGQAGQFNGTSSYITTPHISSVSGANANFSVSFWFKLNSLTATNLIQLSGNTSNFTHFTIQVGGDGLLYLDAYGSAFNWSGLSAISANQWYNVIVVNTGATSIAYLNGLASNTLTHNLTYAGTYSTIGGRYVAGSIFTGEVQPTAHRSITGSSSAYLPSLDQPTPCSSSCHENNHP